LHKSQKVSSLNQIEKYNRLLIYHVCVINCVTKYLNAKFKEDIYFVKEVETQLREKPLQGSQTLDFHYSKDKTSNKALALTYPLCNGHIVHSDVYLYTNASQPGLLPEWVFKGIL
jgi:hypothetical protein